MTRTYRLEFNEQKQKFHLDNYRNRENTHGWVTIFEHCTDFEFQFFESYVNRIKKKKLTIEYLFKCADEVKGFMNNLLEYRMDFNNYKNVFTEKSEKL